MDLLPQSGTSGTQTSATGIRTPNANGSSGIFAGWCTYNTFAEWAVKNGSANLYGGATYTPNTASSLGTVNQNSDISGGVNTTLAASGAIGSIRFTNAAARTITLTGFTLTNVSGGILETTLVGANANVIDGGTLTSSNGQDLVVIQNNTSGTLTISSVIADGPTAIGLTKSGADRKSVV